MTNSPQKGFTIVETLVAITILMIAIAGPLTVATKAYTSALNAKDQVIAINLAQEAMEYINNVKDGGGMSELVKCQDTVSSKCGVSGIQGTSPYDPYDFNNNIFKCPNLIKCDLTFNAAEGYAYRKVQGNNSEQTTPFKRYFYTKYVGSSNPESVGRLVTVIVVWQSGTGSHSVKLNQVLTDYPRGL